MRGKQNAPHSSTEQDKIFLVTRQLTVQFRVLASNYQEAEGKGRLIPVHFLYPTTHWFISDDRPVDAIPWNENIQLSASSAVSEDLDLTGQQYWVTTGGKSQVMTVIGRENIPGRPDVWLVQSNKGWIKSYPGTKIRRYLETRSLETEKSNVS